jgi:hypothetical protein
MAVPFHTHTFEIPTATPAQVVGKAPGFVVTADVMPTNLAGYGVNLGAEPFTPTGGSPVSVQDALDRVYNGHVWVTDPRFGIASPVASAAVNTATFQAAFNYCRDNNRQWFIPPGDYAVNELECWTGGVCFGRLVLTNNGQTEKAFRVSPLPADVTTLSMGTLNSWTFIQKGKTQSSDLVSYAGKYVWWYTNDQTFVNRTGGLSGNTLREGVIVNDDGLFYPAITLSKTVTWTSATGASTVIREPISITGLKFYIPSGSVERGGIFYCKRPNTHVYDSSIVNDSGTPVIEGFVAEYCCHVSFTNCSVRRLGENQTNYAFGAGTTVDIAVNNCYSDGGRRGFDSTGGKFTRINGGFWPDGIGSHWSNDLKVTGAYVSSDQPTVAPFHFTGGNFCATGCTIRLQDEQTILFNAREDFYEVSGSLRLEDNDIEINVLTNPTTARILIDLQAGPDADGWDWGRLVYRPNMITFKNNRVKLFGATYSAQTQILTFASGKTFPQGASMGGTIEISGNSFETEGTDPTLVVVTAKDKEWTDGAGYDLIIADVPTLTITHFCAVARVDNNQRMNVTTRNIKSLRWNVNYGAIKTCQLSADTLTRTRPATGSRSTPAGDENEARVGSVLGIQPSYNPPSVAGGASTLATPVTFTVPGAKVGDACTAALTTLPALWEIKASVTAADTVTVYFVNPTATTTDPAIGILTIRVIPS